MKFFTYAIFTGIYILYVFFIEAKGKQLIVLADPNVANEKKFNKIHDLNISSTYIHLKTVLLIFMLKCLSKDMMTHMSRAKNATSLTL